MKWLLVLLAGCNSLLGVHDFEATVDAAPDAQTTFCYGTTDATRVCLTSPPDVPRIFNGLIDTSAANPDCLHPLSGPTGCVLAYTEITVDRLRATGDRPLILISSSTFEVISTGVLDVSSHLGDPGAAGRELGDPDGNGMNNDAGCPTLPAMSGRGGPGGTFGGRGGDGGGGNIASSPAPQTELLGGCPGGIGGSPTAGASGPGGGAVLAIAAHMTITGAINASGAGGGGSANGGGGGGGAGGTIWVDALMLDGTGVLIANGGGGGSGGGGGNGVFGVVGADPDPAKPLTMALGGSGGMGPAGGNGGAGTKHEGTNGAVSIFGSIGGGGGGGTGLIVMTTTFPGVHSPD